MTRVIRRSAAVRLSRLFPRDIISRLFGNAADDGHRPGTKKAVPEYAAHQGPGRQCRHNTPPRGDVRETLFRGDDKSPPYTRPRLLHSIKNDYDLRACRALAYHATLRWPLILIKYRKSHASSARIAARLFSMMPISLEESFQQRFVLA